ncbi:TPA: hypothetical protein ACIJ18_004425, partial [Klebsiella aerogenes]
KRKAQSEDWAFCFCVLWPDTMAPPGGAALTGAADRSPACAACGKIPPLKSSLKLSHLPLADSTFCLFLVIVSYLDV